jgi:chromosome segregation ATPase
VAANAYHKVCSIYRSAEHVVTLTRDSYCSLTNARVVSCMSFFRKSLAVQRIRQNSTRAHELFLAFALQRAVEELYNFQSTPELREAFRSAAKCCSLAGVYGMVADIAVIQDDAIAAAVSSRRQYLTTVIVDNNAAIKRFKQHYTGPISFLALDSLAQALPTVSILSTLHCSFFKYTNVIQALTL